MASFNTASDAVNAAIRIQQACNATNDFQLKIGIHLGEVVFENDDVYGDGVNIASRIETLGTGSSVLFSKTIRDQVKNNAELTISPMGSFEFKNVDEPIEVFAISNPGFVVPRPENMHGKLKTLTKQRSQKKILIAVAIAMVIFSALFIFRLAFIYTNSGQKEKADRVINRFFEYASKNKVEDPWDMSYIFYLKGDYKNAIIWEEKAVEERSPDAYLMNIAIIYNNDKKYFEGPEHQQILKKMGFVK